MTRLILDSAVSSCNKFVELGFIKFITLSFVAPDQ